jgi:hypothetical protein
MKTITDFARETKDESFPVVHVALDEAADGYDLTQREANA